MGAEVSSCGGRCTQREDEYTNYEAPEVVVRKPTINELQGQAESMQAEMDTLTASEAKKKAQANDRSSGADHGKSGESVATSKPPLFHSPSYANVKKNISSHNNSMNSEMDDIRLALSAQIGGSGNLQSALIALEEEEVEAQVRKKTFTSPKIDTTLSSSASPGDSLLSPMSDQMRQILSNSPPASPTSGSEITMLGDMSMYEQDDITLDMEMEDDIALPPAVQALLDGEAMDDFDDTALGKKLHHQNELMHANSVRYSILGHDALLLDLQDEDDEEEDDIGRISMQQSAWA